MGVCVCVKRFLAALFGTAENKEYSQKAADIYHNCQLYIIDGATHGFNNENLSYLGIDMSSLFGNYDNEVWSYIDTYLNALI